jgi:hypothetical protein
LASATILKPPSAQMQQAALRSRNLWARLESPTTGNRASSSIEDEGSNADCPSNSPGACRRAFPSDRIIASQTLIQRTRLSRHPAGPVGMTVRYLHWPPHTLSPEQKCSRVPNAQDPCAPLKSANHNPQKNTSPLGESLFCMRTGFGQMWLPGDEAPDTGKRHMISSKKLTVTMA